MSEQCKDSPLGEIPKGWSVRALVTLASEITSGATPTSGSTRYYCATGGLPFAKIDDLTASATRFIGQTALQVTRVALRETALVEYPAGTLLLSMYGTIGLVKTTVRPMCANQALAALVPPFDCDSAFLAHVLEWCRPKWDRFKAQTTQANINGRIVKEFLLPVPPEPEQRRIAEILDAVDDAIRQTERVIAKLEQVKAGMLRDLLTRGIDDNGEVRDPERHPEQFKDSPLGKIPKGWRATTLGDVAEYINGFAFKPHHWREAGLPIIRIAQMLDPREAVDRCPVAIPERHVVQDGELLFSWSATLAVVVWDRGPALVNQHIFRVVPRDGIHRNFLFHLLSSNVERLAAQSHGTTMKHVTRGDLLPFEVVMPPESEQRRIAERLDHHQSQLRQEAITLEKLRATKHGLADDLLTGRVRVNTREAVPA